MHGLIRGRCARLLLDARALPPRTSPAAWASPSPAATTPRQAARWLEGFLSGSGLLLIHDDKLLGLIDAWVSQIDPAIFQELLPLLRRTFATFPAPMPADRTAPRQARPASPAASATGDAHINVDLGARRALPLLMTILGDPA